MSYNFYQNTIVLLDKGLVSPISAASLAMYSVKIAEIDDSGPRKIYNIKIRPRNPKDLAFTGNIWIEDSSFALMRLALEVNNSSNLNYVEKFKITQEYEPTAAGAWINTKSRILVDVVEVNTKAAGLVATSTTTYRNIKVNQDRPMSFYAEKVGVSGQALHKPDSFWPPLVLRPSIFHSRIRWVKWFRCLLFVANMCWWISGPAGVALAVRKILM